MPTPYGALPVPLVTPALQALIGGRRVFSLQPALHAQMPQWAVQPAYSLLHGDVPARAVESTAGYRELGAEHLPPIHATPWNEHGGAMYSPCSWRRRRVAGGV